MAQFIVSCPGCQQPLQCEEEWAGQTIQCPSCQTALIVPGAAAPPPPASPPARKSIPGASAGQAGKSTKAKGKGKQPMTMQKGLGILAIMLVCGVAGFFGFKLLLKMQDKMNAADRRERELGGGTDGQVAHISTLNDVLDATDVTRYSSLPAPSSVRDADLDDMRDRLRSGFASQTAAVMPTNDLPILPVDYTLDVVAAKIPETKANGRISGTNFVVETARLDLGPTSQPLRLRQGNPLSPDVEVIVYLKLKLGESPAGKTWTVAKTDKSREIGSVTKLWKPNPKFAAKRKDFFSGYALKLELAAVSEGVLRAKIYLAMPDPEQSVVAGVFYAEAPAVTGVAVPPLAPEAAATPSAMQKGRPNLQR